MGLFDKRKKGDDDFDSPVENIDLSAPAAAHTSEPSLRQAEAEPEPPREVEFEAPAYGIDDAISLMRALPADNIELVVQVVKRTLESTNVKTGTIIEDASRKQADIEGRIDVLKKDIAEYEQEIATRRDEITKLEADHKETSIVKERLQLAEKLSTQPTRKPSTTNPPPAGASKPAAAAPARKPGGTLPPASSSSGITNSSTSNTASGTAGSRQQTTAKGTTIIAKK